MTKLLKKFLDKGNINKNNWYGDRYYSLFIQRNIYLALIFLMMVVCLVISFVIVNVVNSSKKVDPFVIEVQEKTGIATVVDQLSVQQFIANELIVKYFINQYINAREGFNVSTFEHMFFRVVRLMSSYNVFSQFRSELNSANSAISLDKNKIRKVFVKSMIFLDPIPNSTVRTAQVRFKVNEYNAHNNSSRSIKETHKVVLMDFSFTDQKLSKSQRFINPLGFTVTNYNSDEEVQN